MSITRYRSNAQFGPGPRRPLSREDRARLRFLVAQHRRAGHLTASWWDVAEALLTFVGPDGRCDPSVESLGERAGGLVASTVHLALSALERLGLLRRFPRLIRAGWRCQQTSSAYVLLPSSPGGAPAELPAPLVRKQNLTSSSSSPWIGAGATMAPDPDARAALERIRKAREPAVLRALLARRAGAAA
jgi:hypothetical protein